MNFKVLEAKTRILFLLVVIFLYLTVATTITAIFTAHAIHVLFLVLTFWFAGAATLIFHYLLWKNLDFLHNINWHNINNFTFAIIITSYIVLFPLICLLTIAFLIIFSIIVLILIINNFFKKNPSYKEKRTVNY